MQPNQTEGSLTITWFGQATFLVSSSDGTRILIDPVMPDFGYDLPTFERVDAVLVTHNHRDHNYVAAAPDSPHLLGLDASGHFQPIKRQVGSASVYDAAAFHDDVQGQERGEDALWVVDIDGLRLIHMGDFGQHELTNAQLAALGQPDILMLPVGNGPTIDAATAHHIVAQLQPAIAIPMHYLTEAIKVSVRLHPIDEFLGQSAPTNAPHTITLHKSDLVSGAGQIVVMSYK